MSHVSCIVHTNARRDEQSTTMTHPAIQCDDAYCVIIHAHDVMTRTKVESICWFS
jgi:hypothetical protein